MLEEALTADRNGDIQSAASLYEQAIAGGDHRLEVLLNLALLYWQATDFGLAAAKKLSADFLGIAGRRYSALLQEARERFPSSTAVEFWLRYTEWTERGEPLELDECRELLRRDPSTLIPAMRIFGATKGAEAETEARKLLADCLSDGTTGARYVVSVLEGILRRTQSRP